MAFTDHDRRFGKRGQYVFVAPVERFEFFEAKVLEIDRCIICSRRSAQLRLARLEGWRAATKDDKQRALEGSAFLLVRMKGRPLEKLSETISQCTEELDVLACAWAYYQLGHRGTRFGLRHEVHPSRADMNLIGARSGPNHYHWRFHGAHLPTQLTDRWWAFHRTNRLRKLFAIRHDSSRTRPWRRELWRAAILIGRSHQTRGRTDAFLKEFMALDVLLLRRYESRRLTDRLEGLLGWAGRINAATVRHLYQLRCKIVHDGRMDCVRPLDLFHLDYLVLNVFRNLWLLRRWRRKQDLIEFAEQRAASKDWDRTDGLSRIAFTYNEKHYEALDR